MLLLQLVMEEQVMIIQEFKMNTTADPEIIILLLKEFLLETLVEVHM